MAREDEGPRVPKVVLEADWERLRAEHVEMLSLLREVVEQERDATDYSWVFGLAERARAILQRIDRKEAPR